MISINPILMSIHTASQRIQAILSKTTYQKLREIFALSYLSFSIDISILIQRNVNRGRAIKCWNLFFPTLIRCFTEDFPTVSLITHSHQSWFYCKNITSSPFDLWSVGIAKTDGLLRPCLEGTPSVEYCGH